MTRKDVMDVTKIVSQGDAKGMGFAFGSAMTRVENLPQRY